MELPEDPPSSKPARNWNRSQARSAWRSWVRLILDLRQPKCCRIQQLALLSSVFVYRSRSAADIISLRPFITFRPVRWILMLDAIKMPYENGSHAVLSGIVSQSLLLRNSIKITIRRFYENSKNALCRNVHLCRAHTFATAWSWTPWLGIEPGCASWRQPGQTDMYCLDAYSI